MKLGKYHIGIIGFIVIAGAGYFIYKRYKKPKSMQMPLPQPMPMPMPSGPTSQYPYPMGIDSADYENPASYIAPGTQTVGYNDAPNRGRDRPKFGISYPGISGGRVPMTVSQATLGRVRVS